MIILNVCVVCKISKNSLHIKTRSANSLHLMFTLLKYLICLFMMNNLLILVILILIFLTNEIQISKLFKCLLIRLFKFYLIIYSQIFTCLKPNSYSLKIRSSRKSTHMCPRIQKQALFIEKYSPFSQYSL